MLTQARLTLKLHRFTTLAAVALLAGLAFAALYVASHLRGVGASTSCLLDWMSNGPPELQGTAASPCEQVVRQFFDVSEHEAGQLMGALSLVPLVVGLLAGVALVGREIEERTAAVAWSLTPSRTRWLIGRVVPVGLVLLALLLVAAVGGSELWQAREPWISASASFDGYGQRGWIVVATGLLAFSIAVLAGATIGRVLPALIVAGLATFLVLGAVDTAKQAWVLPAESTLVDVSQPADKSVAPSYQFGAIQLEQLYRLADGRLVGSDRVRPQPDGKLSVDGQTVEATPITRLVPGSKYRQVEAIEAAALLALSGIALGASALVVRRRRPA